MTCQAPADNYEWFVLLPVASYNVWPRRILAQPLAVATPHLHTRVGAPLSIGQRLAVAKSHRHFLRLPAAKKHPKQSLAFHRPSLRVQVCQNLQRPTDTRTL